MKRILITGAAGRVGRAVRPHLRQRFTLRSLDVVPVEAGPGEDTIVGDLNDAAVLRAALEGVDAVVHLAAVHGHALTFEASLDANYRAVVALLEATKRSGVRRFVYASSHHVFGLHPRTGFDPHTAPPAPDAYYGLGKAFGELACAMYAHRYGLRTLIVRIGNADPQVGDDRALRLWVSGRDLAQLFALGVEHDDIRYDVVYGVSICPQPLFVDAHAASLGYAPNDRADEHLAPGFVPYEAMPERLGRDFVGGAYAMVPLPNHLEDEA